MKRAFFDKTSRNIVQKVVILCDFHVTETYGHIIVTRKYCIFMQDVVILHSKIRDKRRLAVNLLYFLRARCFARCTRKFETCSSLRLTCTISFVRGASHVALENQKSNINK